MADKASTEHFAIGSQIAIEALKSLLLVNGGSATALIALTDKAAGKANYGIPVLLFGAGALLNAFTLVVGYFSQLAYANHVLAVEKENEKDAQIEINKHNRLQYCAILLLSLSLISSVAGMTTAFRETL